ncbi:MAG: BamA/TamA family outer membrane protein [Holophaga sp.]|nr:BamA/TamA family outer membrane protein [Holophaga sp.]
MTKLEVVGTQKQTPETVLFKAGLKEGDDLRTVDLTEVLDRLWATGSFDDIKFEVTDEAGGKKLTIRVKERPLIKEVDYRGGTELGLSTIKDKIKDKKLTIAPDSIYDPEATRKVKNLLVDLAGEKGFMNPVIDVSLEPMGPTMSRLVFDIKEGGKTRIYRIAFRGNKIISDSRLRSAMKKTGVHGMFSWFGSKDLLVQNNLDEDIGNIKKEYWKKGYKDVFVGKPIIDVVDRTSAKQKKQNGARVLQGKSPRYDLRATLTFPVMEGDQFMEGTFKLEGNDKVFKGPKGEEFYRTKIAEVQRNNRSWLARWFNVKPSLASPRPGAKPRPFDLDALTEGLDKVREAYSDQGYIMFRANRTMTVREDGGVNKVDVDVKVDEGEQYTVHRIAFEGNTKTKDKVLRRSMILKEGDVFRTELFKDSFTGIGQLGYFDVKTTEPKVDYVPDKPQVDITIRGDEAGVNELTFQGGYGSVYGFSLGANFSTKNLGGGGETLSLGYTIGQYQRNISLSYTEPFLMDMPYSLTTAVSNGSTDYSASRVGSAYAYKQFSRSIGTSVGTRLSTFLPDKTWAFFTNYSVAYRFSLIRIEGGRNYYFRNTNSQLTSTINQNLTYSTINHPFKPTAGQKIGLGIEYGGWQFGTDTPFYRTTLEYEKVTSLSERHIFAINSSYGFIKNLSNDQLPVWDLYRPGGENSIRGYRFGQVGSVMIDNNLAEVVVGGSKQFITNLEYQFKIADEFRTVLFYDMGQAWAPGTQIFSTGLKRSAGVELRFFLPISPAPLRLIWARKLNPYAFDDTGQNDFQFSIGTTF